MCRQGSSNLSFSANLPYQSKTHFNNNIDSKIDRNVEIDINKNEVDVFHIINKDIISYSR